MDTRLDVLLHATDFLGIGHVSISVAVGMALLRSDPNTRTVIATGYAEPWNLAPGVPFRWSTLPSYVTVIRDGRAVAGDCSADVGERSAQLCRLVTAERPQALLVDHRPQGPGGELLAALEVARKQGTSCFLGVRSVVGQVKAFWTAETARTFARYYSGLLWYGDSAATGSEEIDALRRHFAVEPTATGYVCRASELERCGALVRSDDRARLVVVAFTWCTKESLNVLSALLSLLIEWIRNGWSWNIYLGPGAEGAERDEIVSSLIKAGCNVSAPGITYLRDLTRCRLAIVYGGYNTITDLWWSQTPAIVLTRAMKDREQALHLGLLATAENASVKVIDELSASERILRDAAAAVSCRSWNMKPVDLQGAEVAARFILSNLKMGA